MRRNMAVPIRVMIVADSAVARQAIARAITNAPGMAVAATAADPIFALRRMREAWPDVIILDVEMPRMDGPTFLHRLMAERPTPVVVCSPLAERDRQTAPDARDTGAFAVIAKPSANLSTFFAHAADEIIAAVRAAAGAKLRPSPQSPREPPPELSADAAIPPAVAAGPHATTDRLIAIGTSAGGTQALESVLTRLPATVAGIVIVQHMPARFTAMFAERLDALCAIKVREAHSHDRVMQGQALIAPGGRHLTVKRIGSQYYVEVVDGPLFNRHRPSVDVLFRSVARCAGRNALGAIMTGMGDDGARGLLEMRDAGAVTIAQDQATSIVFGMPGEAIRRGAAGRVLALDDIPAALVKFSCDSRR